jgi:hypothetical protein
MHPLAPNLEALSDEELHTKRSELLNRVNQAYRFGNADMVNQLQLLLQDYAMEVERRNQKIMSDAHKSGRLGKSGDDPAKDITR